MNTAYLIHLANYSDGVLYVLAGLLVAALGVVFSVLAAPGHAPTAVTGGVADALVTTATGLFIAILGLIAFNAFNSQVRQILLAMDSVKTMLLNRMDGHLMPDNRENLLRAVAPKMAAAVARAG